MVLGPLDGTVEVGKQAAACDRCCHAYVLEEVGKPSAFREGAQHKIFPFLVNGSRALQQNPAAATASMIKRSSMLRALGRSPVASLRKICSVQRSNSRIATTTSTAAMSTRGR